jgi:hypothetical protein
VELAESKVELVDPKVELADPKVEPTYVRTKEKKPSKSSGIILHTKRHTKTIKVWIKRGSSCWAPFTSFQEPLLTGVGKIYNMQSKNPL